MDNLIEEKYEQTIDELESRLSEGLGSIRILEKDIEDHNKQGFRCPAWILFRINKIGDELMGEMSYENYARAIGL